MRCAVLLSAGLATGAALAGEPAERTLCQPAEVVVFSCTVGAKLVSLCRSGTEPRRLGYRFGTPTHIELAYPEAGADGTFERSSGPLYGGAITGVSFRRGEYEYGVYARIGRAAGGGDPEFEDGLAIARSGKRIKTLVCDDGGAGFRESIDWLPKKPG
jgi:hypothetical protein